jgi:hypothetical protein
MPAHAAPAIGGFQPSSFGGSSFSCFQITAA